MPDSPPPTDPGQLTHTEHEDNSWTISVGDHLERNESPIYGRSRKHMIAAVQAAQPWYFGPPPYQDHHGGGCWVLGADGVPSMYLLPAGIEWSAQFCADPTKVDGLRKNAKSLVDAFPLTRGWYVNELGMTLADLKILDTPIVDADGVAAWTDSFWNASVPLPQSMHTGFPPKSDPGYHHAPKPIVDIRLFARDDFVLFPKAGVAVAPVSPPGSGDGRVRVLWTADRVDHSHDEPLPDSHPVARAAFAQQTEDTPAKSKS